jgi:hypothetical protein
VWIVQSITKTFYPPDLAPRESYPTFGIRAGLGRLSVARVEEERGSEGGVGLRPYLSLLTLTNGRRSTGCGSAGCAGRTRPPLVGVRSGPRSRRRSSYGSAPAMSLDGAVARRLVGASERKKAPLRPLDGGAFTQQ